MLTNSHPVAGDLALNPKSKTALIVMSMIVRCQTTLLDELHGNKLMRVDYSKSGMLRINGSYHVYAISLWRSSLNYLILPQDARVPNWYPAELFAVTEETLDPDSHFMCFGKEDPRGLIAVWGYPEMVKDPDHYVNLIERDPTALQIFFMRKELIDSAK